MCAWEHQGMHANTNIDQNMGECDGKVGSATRTKFVDSPGTASPEKFLKQPPKPLTRIRTPYSLSGSGSGNGV